jgi:hypothetical protein
MKGKHARKAARRREAARRAAADNAAATQREMSIRMRNALATQAEAAAQGLTLVTQLKRLAPLEAQASAASAELASAKARNSEVRSALNRVACAWWKDWEERSMLALEIPEVLVEVVVEIRDDFNLGPQPSREGDRQSTARRIGHRLASSPLADAMRDADPEAVTS